MIQVEWGRGTGQLKSPPNNGPNPRPVCHLTVVWEWPKASIPKCFKKKWEDMTQFPLFTVRSINRGITLNGANYNYFPTIILISHFSVFCRNRTENGKADPNFLKCKSINTELSGFYVIQTRRNSLHLDSHLHPFGIFQQHLENSTWIQSIYVLCNREPGLWWGWRKIVER